MRRPLLCLTLLGAIGVAGTARAADPREQQLAQALFDEARQLMEQKRYSEACPKLAESQRLDPGGGTLLNLALCHEKERKIATAHAEYNEAMSLALRDGRKEREELARERIRAIEGVVPRVSVTVSPAADVEGLEVKLDGLVLRRAAWGMAAMVDPGTHRIEANAPGRQAWSATVSVSEKEKKTVDVPVLAPLAALPPGVAIVPAPSPPAQPAPAPQPAPASTGSTLNWEPSHPNVAFYVTLGIGGVAAATSAVSGVIALDANSTAKDGCIASRGYCKDQSSLDAASRARTMAWVSTGALAVAGVAGIALLIIPPRTRGRPIPQVGIAPTPGGAALRVGGAF